MANESLALIKAQIAALQQIAATMNGEQIQAKADPDLFGGLPVSYLPIDNRPLYDAAVTIGSQTGFFQSGALERGIINMLISPLGGIANDIPVRPTVVLDEKVPFLLGYDINDVDGATEPTTPCDPAIPVTSSFEFAKMSYAMGKHARQTKTIDVLELFRRAQMRQYDDFYVMGGARGVSARITPTAFSSASNGINRDLVVSSAVRRKMHEVAVVMQRWIMRRVWTADPANNNGEAKEFYGLLRLINGDYPTSGLPLWSTAANLNSLAALNSVVEDANGSVIDDNDINLYTLLQSIEQELTVRADLTGMSPVNWKIYTIQPIWEAMVRMIPCQALNDGCSPVGSVINAVNMNVSDSSSAFFNMISREQMRASKSITLNGRRYEVVVDNHLPYTVASANGAYTYNSSLFFVPFTAGGEEVLYWEHMDYREVAGELGPVSPSSLEGWTDDGIFMNYINKRRNCFEVQTQFEPRLVFKTPHFAARIDNLGARSSRAVKMHVDNLGNPTSWLVPPTIPAV